MDKRTFVKSFILGAAGVFASGLSAKALKTRKKWDGIFRQTPLPYSFDSLEPFMDAETLKQSYQQHHAAYTSNLNSAVAAAGLTGITAHQLMKRVSEYPYAIRYNGGGYLNYKLFWRMLEPTSGHKPSTDLQSAIERDFGSLDSFCDQFSHTAHTAEVPGWVWLIADKYGKLKITTTQNQDNPLMDTVAEQGTPVVCLEIGGQACANESRRAEYISTFWNVVNWDCVSKRYKYAIRRTTPLLQG